MSRPEAVKIDKSRYVAYDEGSGLWGIFGTESKFCYATYSSRHEATANL
jgi:hypothetical protein